MDEKRTQVAKYDAKYTFRQVDRADFNEFINSITNGIKLLDVDQIVYYIVASSNRVLGKSDYTCKKFYIAKKII